ncbi:MAG: GPR endopeptidase [Lachnospiraceae bacterium]|nr:GPR endopeptidase [Lachnospiraceae bacterium]
MEKNAETILAPRTDLAVEMQEELEEESYLEGISIRTKIDRHKNIKETIIQVENKTGANILGKPEGFYITIEGDDLSGLDESYHESMSNALAKHLKKLLGDYDHILVAGLGNQEVTPDALGPYVVQNLYVTRHLKQEKIIKEAITLSAITPGVMAQTGMETGEILKALVKEIKPEVIVAVDALAARSSARLNKTIQISDTGIAPGSGVGNHRQEITEKTMGIKVIAIGVPTVIAVPTIVNDALEQFLKTLGKGKLVDFYEEFTDQEKYQLAYEIVNPYLADMFVTPKNIDEAVKKISYTISEALNQLITA